ncbi:Hydrogenase maturation factor HybF [BD1-7 clade bacterium]|uniref:Hydrogenase maturation factor HypA n=1 Tax=BD1-7 clade bacterium TaxID=2029982 RepID=A0A5S9QS72_9GAMM|nr:Hydrogenase maturation factor HybF [BD1-7 clade bacterium]CAA0121059.1 Hydrogenase maturation factor HybF [BD1-7 clade bacterium]
MHEVSLAENLIECIEQQAQKNRFERVEKIEVEVGELSCVDPGALEFALQALAEGTVIDGASLAIGIVTGQLQCRACKHTYNANTVYTSCPECHQTGSKKIGGDDAQLIAIYVASSETETTGANAVHR